MEEKDHSLTEEKKTNHQKDRLKYKPVRDTVLILCSAVVMGVIILATFLNRPNTTNSPLCVEIAYTDPKTGKSHLLYDKNDLEKNTAIAFPESGEKTLFFSKNDSHLYLDDGVVFDFVGEEVGITLYADKSIQFKRENIACPNHDCSRFGRVYASYVPVICLPNHIQATIVTDTFPKFDA